MQRVWRHEFAHPLSLAGQSYGISSPAHWTSGRAAVKFSAGKQERSIVVSVENEEERHPRRYGRARRRSALGDARDRRETHVASKVRTPSPIRARTHSDAVRI